VPFCGIIPLAGRVLPGARLRQRCAAFCVFRYGNCLTLGEKILTKFKQLGYTEVL